MNFKEILLSALKLGIIRLDPDYDKFTDKYTSPNKKSKFNYHYLEKNSNEIKISLHNHSDGMPYTLEEMAKTASERGYKIFGVTDHNSDSKFGGEIVKYYPQYEIYLVRGKENRCKNIKSVTYPLSDLFSDEKILMLKNDEMSISEIRREKARELGEENAGKIEIAKVEYNDVLLLGYNQHIDSFRPIISTINDAKNKGAIVIATSPFNSSAKGLCEKRLEDKRIFEKLDALEILNADSGLGPLCYSDILACKFAKEKNMAGIYVNDAHTLREIGLAGISIKKDYIPFAEEQNLTMEDYLKNPRRIEDNPLEFIEGLRGILQNRAFTNEGRYIPLFSIAYADKRKTLSHKHAIIRD